MTKFFATPDNPNGYKLEHLLAQVQMELMRRSNKIVTDRRAEARMTANLIADVLDNPHDEANIAAVRAKVHALTSRFPVYQ